MTTFEVYDRVLEQAAAWRADGHAVALATVVSTWGSAPRPPGSQMAVNNTGAFMGSVSGGCVEGAVVTEALAAITDGQPRLIEFGVANSEAWAVGLACGGKIRIFVESISMKPALLDTLLAAKTGGHTAVVATTLATGESRLVLPHHLSAGDPLFEPVRATLAADRAQTIETADGEIFLNVFNPPRRLAIVGAVHIAQPLSLMAATAGYAVTVIDPRTAFATDARFPGVTISHDWPDEAMIAFKPDRRSAVVTLTHEPKLDDVALDAALRASCFYIGALGSTRTHAARLKRLEALGHGPEALARIHGPVGLAIGAKSPVEIAVSIMAEIIAVMRKGSTL